jgi:transposase
VTIGFSRKYGLHARAIRAWKEQLLALAARPFASGVDAPRDQEEIIRDLHAKIGELTVERDVLFIALER